MKFLCFNIGHSSNWCYYDTNENKIYYFTAEREFNVKNATVREKHILQYVERRFNFKVSNPEHIIINSSLYTKKFPFDVNTELVKIDIDKTYSHPANNIFIVDHHYAHVLSSLALDSNCNVGISIDGGGNYDRRISVFKNIQDINNVKLLDNFSQI